MALVETFRHKTGVPIPQQSSPSLCLRPAPGFVLLIPGSLLQIVSVFRSSLLELAAFHPGLIQDLEQVPEFCV